MGQAGTTSESLLAEIQSIAKETIAVGGFSVSIGSLSRSDLKFELPLGYSDIVHAAPVQSDQSFAIGSITKVFVAVVTLQLVEEGYISLSDTVAQHLPEAVYKDIEDAAGATIDQLLSHTAGIDSWEDDPIWITHGRGKDMRVYHKWRKTEPLDYIRRPKKSAPSPGTFYYSNTNYTLLGLLIENATQNTAESEIRRRILQPLNMNQTFVDSFEDVEANVPQSYQQATAAYLETAGAYPAFAKLFDDTVLDVSDSNLSVSWMAGGMFSSAPDLIIFARALQRGQLLSHGSMQLMTRWKPALPCHEMGRGLFRKQMPGERAWLGHSGGVLGFSSVLWWDEDGDCAVSVLSNEGTMHAKMKAGVSKLLGDTEFLSLARRLINISVQGRE